MLCTEEVDSDDVNIDEQSAAAAQLRYNWHSDGSLGWPFYEII